MPTHESLFFTIFMGALAIIFNAIAVRRALFTLPKSNDRCVLRWWHVVCAFLIYIGTSFVIALSGIVKTLAPTAPVIIASAIFFLLQVSIITLLFWLLFSGKQKRAFQQVWQKDQTISLWKDVRFGLIIFVLAFPTVAFVEMSIEWILTHIYHFTIPPQQAVQYLQASLAHPFSFITALINILLFAPFVEELLFRGLLQSFLRRYIGSKATILLTSLAFAFFHFAPQQKANNIAIIASLFAFSLFLCMAYEKRRSLMTTISTHAAFNLFSTLIIIG